LNDPRLGSKQRISEQSSNSNDLFKPVFLCRN
jgi:hypothetical protein